MKDPVAKLSMTKQRSGKCFFNVWPPPYFGEDHFFPNYLELIEKLIDSVPFFYFYFNISDNPEILADIMRKKC
ncbi:MAG TPA: hypothetical protein PLW37_14570 [bacterium]|nr:hypothetical protein [bacterium]